MTMPKTLTPTPCIFCVGRAVECTICGQHKTPRGRSAPLEMANGLCDWDCPGYREPPHPGDLWPGETREDFGYGIDKDHQCP